MRVALTGASGFIGRRANGSLRDAGHAVAASDMRPADGVIALDLRDREAVRRWIADTRPDVVVHSGAISGPMVAPDDPALVFDVNAGGTLNLLEAMRGASVKRMVLVSSIAVYGPRGDTSPVPESATLHAYESYSASKIAAEAMLQSYCYAFGIAGVALRVSTVYGPGRVTANIIADLIRAGRDGGSATVSGHRCSIRQYIHVDDAARAISQAVERPLPGFVPLNITGGSYVPEAHVGEIIRRHLPRLTVITDPDRPGGDGDFGPLDITAARLLISYEPKIALDDGLARLVAETP